MGRSEDKIAQGEGSAQAQVSIVCEWILMARPAHAMLAQHFRSRSMNPNEALWEKGDFTRLARTLRGSGRTFAKPFGFVPGMKPMRWPRRIVR